MSKALNKVILVGNAGKDAVVKNTVCRVVLATQEEWRDMQTKEKQARTEWHQVVFFGKLAEIAAKYIKKGDKIYIEGTIRSRSWQDANEVNHHTKEIIAKEMMLLSYKDYSKVDGNVKSSDDSENDYFNDDIQF